MKTELEKSQAKLERAQQKISILEKMIEDHTRELYLRNQELERKNKELEQFTYISSHDLQEPLRTITVLIDMLRMKYEPQLDETAITSFNFITRATSRMSNLIKALLDYSRLGKQHTVSEVDCNKVTQMVLADLQVYIQEAEATIVVNHLPVINAYDVELRLMFQNLVSNAIKFRRKDALPHIEISAVCSSTHWTFSVKDNGIGIDRQYADKIFTIFQRLHGREEYEGIGIGLAHCKKIAALHQGEIWFETEPNGGTTFFFTIKNNLV